MWIGLVSAFATCVSEVTVIEADLDVRHLGGTRDQIAAGNPSIYL